jgi:hypothetical protein
METRAHARNTDPDTSHAAAASLSKERLERLELAVLQALHYLGGKASTGEVVAEVADKVGGNWQSISPRFAQLKRQLLIEDTGERRDRQQVLQLTYWGARRAIDSELVMGKELGRVTTVQLAWGLLPPSISMEQVDSLTREQWSEILGGKMQMVAWTRRRFKRMIRLLTEGRVYDDPQDDGRRKEARQEEAAP